MDARRVGPPRPRGAAWLPSSTTSYSHQGRTHTHSAFNTFYNFFVGHGAPSHNATTRIQLSDSRSSASDSASDDDSGDSEAAPSHSTPYTQRRTAWPKNNALGDDSFLERLMPAGSHSSSHTRYPLPPSQHVETMHSAPQMTPTLYAPTGLLQAAAPLTSTDTHRTMTRSAPVPILYEPPTSHAERSMEHVADPHAPMEPNRDAQTVKPKPDTNEHEMPPLKRKRGRPRKEAMDNTASMPVPKPQPIITPSTPPPMNDGTTPKRKRGRPRKRPLEPHEEVALMAAKQSSNIPPWRIMESVDRPPVYPETHVFLRTPRPIQAVKLWDSPERAPRPRAQWWHYRRPTLRHVPAHRADGQTAEPLPTPPPGRRPKTRVDYAALQHRQLAHRARGIHLDLPKLWKARVRQAKDQPLTHDTRTASSSPAT